MGMGEGQFRVEEMTSNSLPVKLNRDLTSDGLFY